MAEGVSSRAPYFDAAAAACLPTLPHPHPPIAAGKVYCRNCVTASSPLWMEGKDKEPLCQACGAYWEKYRTYRPLTVRQQGYAKARAEEIANASASYILESLSSVSHTITPGTQAVMQVRGGVPAGGEGGGGGDAKFPVRPMVHPFDCFSWCPAIRPPATLLRMPPPPCLRPLPRASPRR